MQNLLRYLQNLLEFLNDYNYFIIGILGIIVGTIGLIYAIEAYHHAKGAEEKSQEVLENLFKEVRDFDEFAKRSNEDFLVPKPGETMMSLISPAFAALSKTEDQKWFNEFEKRLNRLVTNGRRNLQVLVAKPEPLVEWYITLVNAMENNPDEKREIIERIIAALKTVQRRFIDLVEKKKCEFKTRDITPQVFVRKDRSEPHKAAMFGLLASDFHEKIPKMLGKKPTYDEMVSLSMGVYSKTQRLVMQQESIFSRIWKEESVLTKDEVDKYFEEVIKKIQNFCNNLEDNHQNHQQ